METIVLDSVGSTNDYVKQNRETLGDRCVVIALEQTRGRGRLGREWAPVDGSLALSILLNTENAAAGLTLVCALAVSDILERLFGIRAEIKWPNDVLINGKKVCGILVEGVYSGSVSQCAIVGIGLNLNNAVFPDDILDRATSVFLETGIVSGVVETGKTLAREVLARCEESPAGIIQEYSAKCATLGKKVCARGKRGETRGLAVSVNADGSLLIETENGPVSVYSGEVSLTGH